MEENKFDKDNINIIAENDIPSSFMVFENEKVYDIKENRENWWKCPKCGGNISFDSMVEDFDESIDENQFTTVYSWECEDCGAHGNVFAVVNPLCISIEEDDYENEEYDYED